MPVTGVLAADFSSFYDAVQKADVQLKDFEGDAAKVESSLSRMADSFSGQKVISEATLMAEVFEKMGGATKFTTAELDRMGNTAAEAINKMKALGQEVPADLQKMADATTKTSSATGELTSKYKQFDDMLEIGDVNINKHIKGLDQLRDMSGKTAKELGVFGTAGAIAGAAMLGWEFGKVIDGWFGLSDKIQKATESLMGWNSASQAAANQQETLARASEIAGKPITDLTQAIKIIADETARATAAKIDWSGKLAEAQRQVRGLTDAQIAEIEVAQRAGATAADITAKYGINALAIQELAKHTATLAEVEKKRDEEKKRRMAELAQLEKDYAKLMSDVANERGEAIMKSDKAAMDWITANVKATAAARQKAAADQAALDAKTEEERIAANQREIDEILKVGAAHAAGGQQALEAAGAAVEGYQQVAQQITITGEAVKEWINLMKYTAEVNAILGSGSGLFTTQSQRERIAGLGGPSLPSSAGLGGGGQQVFNNTYNIVDTESNIAKRVGDNIMRQVKSGTQLGTA